VVLSYLPGRALAPTVPLGPSRGIATRSPPTGPGRTRSHPALD